MKASSPSRPRNPGTPKVRRVLFWLHLGVGLLFGIAIAFLAITGILIGFQAQLTHFDERSVRVHPSAAGLPCLPVESLVKRAQGEVRVRAASVTLFADRQRPALLTLNPQTVYLVDPCDGSLLQAGPSRSRAFFAAAKDLHRWVAFGGQRHEDLRAVKNAANLGFAFLLVSGLVLWVPRNAAGLRSALLVRRRFTGRAREWNLHNVAGIWLALPLFVLSATGTVMAYTWANNALYRAAGSPLPKPAEEKAAPKSPQRLDGLNAMVARAMVQDPAWHGLTVRLPSATDKTVGMTTDDRDAESAEHRNQLTLTRAGTLQTWEPFRALPRGRQLRLQARYLHTGERFGIVGQAVACLAGCGALLLVWTGVSLALRRARAYRQRQMRPVTRASAA